MVRYIKRLGASILFIALAGGGIGACGRHDSPPVNLQRKSVLKPHTSVNRRDSLRIGMGAMVTPKEGYAYYVQLKTYLERKLGMTIQLVDRDNYDQINKMLKDGELDAAFVCAGPYVEGHEQFGLELLTAPQVKGETVYHSYIIVPKDSPARKLEDLRGKTFAFTDPKSNTGKLIPTYMLALMHEAPETFFKKHVYTYGHDKSIKAVAEGFVDGAAVDSLIWAHMAKKDPGLTKRVRIITRSIPCGIPPFVVSPAMNAGLKKRIQAVMLAMHEDPLGKRVLEGMMVDRFVVPADRVYDSVREMNARLNQSGKGH